MNQKTLFKRLMNLVLASVLIAATAVPAYEAKAEGTEDEPAQASITKILTMPEGTDTPEAEFEFVFEAVSKDDEETEAVRNEMPEISKSISFEETDNGEVTDGTKSVKKEQDLLSGIDWPSAGIYIYEVKEVTDTYDAADDETMTYSEAIYKLYVYVENREDMTDTFVQNVIAERIAKDNGETTDEKADPAPGEFGLVFTNNYIVKGSGSLEDAPASISKTVAGKMIDLGKYFQFDITLTKPAYVTAETTYKAYVVKTGTVVIETTKDNHSTILEDENGSYINIKSGVPVTISLKHGQSLVFPDVHSGASWTVNERGVTAYTPSVVIIENGTGRPVQTGEQGKDLSTGALLIGNHGDNTVDYTNTRPDVNPTGVIINNLPYIIIFALTIGTLILFVVVKSRKRNR